MYKRFTSVIFAVILLTGIMLLSGCCTILKGPCASCDKIPTVTSANGRVWMDRNLGAVRVAQSVDDYQAYGWLYQWGRLADGHETGHSHTTPILSTGNVPGHGHFIATSALPNDWRSQQNDSLWQPETVMNNPCPAGFRVPTETEWETERASWSSNDSAGAFASPLKLVVAGSRDRISSTVTEAGYTGYYWTSTVSNIAARTLWFSIHHAATTSIYGIARAYGCSVRCIKN